MAAEAQMTQALPRPVGNPNPWRGLLALSIFRQLGLLIALAASIALGISVAMWSMKAEYRLLYGGLSPAAASEVMQALDAAKVPYRVDERNGSIMVPADKVYDVRFRLAAQNLPGSSEVGFEILEKEQNFGTSQFVEQARYQRALEVEVGRSISAVNGVVSARVHLALPKQSAFVRNRKPPTASVLLTLSGNGKMAEEQVNAIANMVAAAIPNMDPENVKVVDQRGRLLTRSGADSGLAMSENQLDYVHKLEADYVRRIQDILRPVVGMDGLEAQVNADVDFTRTEQTREIFNPDLPALRSEQTLEEQGVIGAAGVPGALTNQPPGAAVAPEQAVGQSGAATAAGSAPSRKRSTRNYELDRTVSHTVMPVAHLRRLSVAVVVDDHRLVDDQGQVGRRPLNPEETARIESLVREAIGFDAERGDTVKVTNVSFAEPPPVEPVAEPPLWEQPWVLTLSKQVLGVLLVLFLLLGVLRPAMRRLTGADAEMRDMQAKLEASMASRGGSQRQDEGDVVRQMSDDDMLMLPDTATHERRLEVVKKLVQDDPKRVAQVVKDWVNKDG